jgi:Zn-finger nucleic acid-binding protein
MNLKKPSTPEEEYFQKEELERLQKLRARLDAEKEKLREEEEKNLHFMHCPKCGAKMEEVPFRNIIVDRCPRCGYMGFDAGEVELLLGSSEPFIARFLKDFRELFSAQKATRSSPENDKKP